MIDQHTDRLDVTGVECKRALAQVHHCFGRRLAFPFMFFVTHKAPLWESDTLEECSGLR